MSHGPHFLSGQALGELNHILGSTGGGQLTDIDSSHLQLAVNANPIIRRSRTFAASSGLFSLLMKNVHVVGPAATVETRIDPYAAGTTLIAAGFPATVPEGFDLWLISTWHYVAVSVVDFNAAFFSIEYPAVARGLIAPTGIASSTVHQILFMSEAAQAFGDSSVFVGVMQELGTLVASKYHALRIPRGCQLVWTTRNVGAAAGDYRTYGVFGMFPAGLGQDALGAG